MSPGFTSTGCSLRLSQVDPPVLDNETRPLNIVKINFSCCAEAVVTIPIIKNSDNTDIKSFFIKFSEKLVKIVYSEPTLCASKRFYSRQNGATGFFFTTDNMSRAKSVVKEKKELLRIYLGSRPARPRPGGLFRISIGYI
jgi:hypothetical protein